ncbi:MAG TPA: hypothetical protein DEP84_20190 [Chloroflexi bacterium]|nr:hypothetical protein [Chloroflexota bacterium]
MLQRPTLLAILAHPDDESFGPGGTLARYAWQGVDTVLVTATNGGAGVTGGLTDQVNLPAMRHRELMGAAALLGIETVFHWANPDGELAAVPVEEVVSRLVRVLRGLQPQVVITFGPEGGGNEHPDHIAIHHLATTAFDVAADIRQYSTPGLPPAHPAKLYALTVAPEAPQRERIVFLAPTTRIDISAALAVKRAAFYKHRTQRNDRAYYQRYQEEQGAYEWFALLRGQLGPQDPVSSFETDLFAGVPGNQLEPAVSFLA